MSKDFRVYVYPNGHHCWMTQEVSTGFASTGESRAEALILFKNVWNDRAPFTLVDGAPPRPKREDAPQEPGPALDEGVKLPGYAVYRRLAKRFHSDAHPGASFTADQVMGAINELWTAMRGAK